MKNILFLFAMIFTTLSASAESTIDLLQPGCQLDLYSLGKGPSTPLQQEAEWILQIKGYEIRSRNRVDFDSEALRPLQMFGSYKAGNDSLSGEADCSVENYPGGIGRRYTCSYELNLVTVTASGQLITFAAVEASIAQAGSPESFYASIRNQLLQLPSCR